MLKIKLICGLTALPILVLSTFVFGYLEPNYSHFYKSVSTLGAFSAQHTFLMNTLGLFTPGILVCIFSTGFNELLNQKSISSTAPKWLFLFGILFSGLAVPMDMAPIPYLPYTLHYILAYASVTPFLILCFLMLFKLQSLKLKRRYTYPLKIIPAIFIFTQVISPLVIYSGVTQRILLTCIFSWILILAIALLNCTARTDSPLSKEF